MATILVDFENVVMKDGLRGIHFLTEKDRLHIFYSENCRTIRTDYYETIMESQCVFSSTKLKNTGKNGLDFYIACEAGISVAQGEKQIVIISADKGFHAVSDFLQQCKEELDIQVIIAPSIEKALVRLNDSENPQRKQLISTKTTPIDIAIVNERCLQRSELKEKISSLFYDQNSKCASIIDFASANAKRSRKELYTGCLHQFGRREGLNIYHKLKDII